MQKPIVCLVLAIAALIAPAVVSGPATGVDGNCQEASPPAAPIWIHQTVPVMMSPLIWLDVPFLHQSVISVSVGLRMVGPYTVHNIEWSLVAVSGPSVAEESTTQTRWFEGQADWQEVEWVTDATGLGDVRVTIVNHDRITAEMEFTCSYSVVEREYHSRIITPLDNVMGQADLPPYSGLTPILFLPNLGANTMYHFNVYVGLTSGSDPEQVAAWLWRCYRSELDPPYPVGLSHGSRHVENWVGVSALDVLVLTLSPGAFCGLWINNWDPSPQSYTFLIESFSAGVIERATEWYSPSVACVDVGPGQTQDILLHTAMPPGRYLGWARVILNGTAQTGDSEQKTNWYVGIGRLYDNSVLIEGGQKEGYNVRYWTDFLDPYNPWGEGTVLVFTDYWDADFWIHIHNADTTWANYCFEGYIYKYGN